MRIKHAFVSNGMKTVLVFGTFDLLHPGHIWFLRQAAKRGDKLAVVVARDANVKKLKGRLPLWREKRRLKEVRNLFCVSKARLGYKDWSRRTLILKKINPDIIVLGYDQKAKIPAGKWRVARLKAYHPEKYKTTILRRRRRG